MSGELNNESKENFEKHITSEEGVNIEPKPVEEKKEPEKFTTAGGYEAMNVNGMIIRKSESMSRLHDDNETKEEYKVRRKFVQDMYKKKLQPKLFWMSKFSIKGQNYTSTYRKGDEKKGVNINKEQNKEEA